MSLLPKFFLKLTSKDVMLLSLLVIFAGSSLVVGVDKIWIQSLLTCSVCVVLDVTLNFLKKTRYFFPKAGLITGLILALVLPLGVSPAIAIFACVVAIASKQFMRLERHHLFNPATSGLVAAGLVFKIPFGWWGDSLPWLIILLGIVTVVRVRKELQVLSFVITYTIIQYFFLKTSSSLLDLEALKIALGTNSWFFALFMVPEPMTSLIPFRLSPVFGFIVAAAGINLSLVKFTPISNNSLLLGLLTANLIAFLYLYLQRRKSKVQ